MEKSTPSNSSATRKTERKMIEKNRRNHMKNLFSQLNSLLPADHRKKGTLPLPDQIDAAVKYIKCMKKNLEKSREEKDKLSRKRSYSFTTSGLNTSLKSPQIEICKMGPDLDVVFITGLHNHFTFYEIIRMIHEEGAAVAIANFSAVGNSTLHVVHPKIGEFGFNFGASRLSEKLKMFVCGSAGEVESQPELWDFEIQPDIWQFDFPQVLPKRV